MDKTTALNNAQQYAGLVYREIAPCKVFLYGSLAKDTFTEQSDIDIAIIKDYSEDNYWTLTKKINRLTRGIDNRIEPILLQPEDNSSQFLSAVLTSGIELPIQK